MMGNSVAFGYSGRCLYIGLFLSYRFCLALLLSPLENLSSMIRLDRCDKAIFLAAFLFQTSGLEELGTYKGYSKL